MSAPLAIAVAGAAGRMGRELIRTIAADPAHFRLSAAWVAPASAARGSDAGTVAGAGAAGVECALAGETEAEVDAVVDFSTPAACAEIAAAARRLHAPLVCGTTGLGAAAKAALAEVAESIPVLHAANFSLGIAVLTELAALARRRLGDGFDVEILELHHRGKRDAPSGTARALGAMLGDGAGQVRTGARSAREVGYASLRGGAAPGEHTVFFLGPHERLELTHRAQDRAVFAAGALRAASWLAGQRPGRYTLRDCIAAS